MTWRTCLLLAFGISGAVLCPATAWGDLIYFEDFTGQEGKGARGPGPIIDTSGVTWSVDVSRASLADANDFFRVKDNAFVAQDVEGPCIWFSPQLDIRPYTGVSFTLGARGTNNHETTDYLDVAYLLDGVPKQLTNWNGKGSSSHTLVGNFLSETVGADSLTGSQFQLQVTMRNNAANENLFLDDVRIEGQKASVPEPTSLALAGSAAAAIACMRLLRRR